MSLSSGDLTFDLSSSLSDNNSHHDDARWNTSNIDLLKKLIKTKISSAQVAVKLSRETGQTFTRNMVIGKARRMDIPLLGLRKSSTTSTKKKTKPVTDRIVKLKKYASKALTLAEVVANPKSLTILEIRPGQCYWPTSHAFDIGGNNIKFCGHDTDNGDSWCNAHKQIGYVAPNIRRYGFS